MNKLLCLIIVFRFLTIVTRYPNYIHPDQYFQGPQVAHRMVFGYGYLTWEWIMENPIRSPLFPWLLSLPYRLLKFLELDNSDWIAIAPRLYQFIIACLHDIFLLKLNRIVNGPKMEWQVLLLSYTSYVSVIYYGATIINNTECVLTLIAFYLWQRRFEGYNDIISRLVVLFTFCLRGTSIMFWVIVWPYELLSMPGDLTARVRFIIKNLVWVATMVLSSVFLSYLYYGKPYFVEYNFFYYNFYLDWSSRFGTAHFFAYLITYLPNHIGHLLPLFLLGMYLTIKGQQKIKDTDQPQQYHPNNRKLREFIGIIGGVIFFLSLNSHKQERFLNPILPLIYILSLRGWNHIPKLTKYSHLLKCILILLSLYTIGKNLFIQTENIYATLIGQLRRNPEVKSIEFFSFSYVTPLYSDLHKNISIRFPQSTVLQYPTLEDFFLHDPNGYYRSRMESYKSQGYPSHIFVQQHNQMNGIIKVDESVYTLVWSHQGMLYRKRGLGLCPTKLYKLKSDISTKTL